MKLATGSLLFAGLVLLTAAMCYLVILGQGVSLTEAVNALWSASPAQESQFIMHYSWWPRLSTTVLAGATMAIAGVLMQQVLRNPLASPTTLGVTNGASLALLLATIYAPSLLEQAGGMVALLGSVFSIALVLLLAWRSALSPTVVILAGLVVSLYCGALSTVLFLFHADALIGIPFWGAGSMVQSNWQDPIYLGLRLVIGVIFSVMLMRSLRILDLSDEAASSLGASLLRVRLLGLGLASLLTAWVVSAVGVIGFIGLAAPVMASLLGFHHLGPRFIAAAILGALLLTLTDQALQLFPAQLSMLLPTGAATALLGAPLLLWLLPRLKIDTGHSPAVRRKQPLPISRRRLYLALSALIVVCGSISVLLGQEVGNWSWIPESGSWQLLEWRWPRMLAAASAGAMLAGAGTILQRLTGNPMASPELLGISSGASIAMILAIVIGVGSVSFSLYLSGVAGALMALLLIYLLNRNSGFIPTRVLLTGVAINSILDAMQHLLLIDLSGNQLLGWLSGTTYFISPVIAESAAGLAILLLGIGLLTTRWLDILPLGDAQASAIGLPMKSVRLILLGLVALLSTAATLVVGPFSFVGLMAPHMARTLGFNRARPHFLSAAMLGVLLMMVADWLGRQWLYPQEIPVGLVSALLGGSYLMWGLRRF